MRLRLSLPTLIALALAACSGGDGKGAATTTTATSVTGDNGGTLVLATGGDADILFPPLVSTATGRQVVDQVYDHLAEIGNDLNTVGDVGFRPRLAKSWAWGKDSLSLAFSLDDRARWHDGQPLRAADVKFTFDVNRDPKVGSNIASLITSIDSVTVRDSLTPVFWFKRRSPELFYDAVYQMHILPSHVFAAIPRDGLRTAEASRKPIGTGRFRFVAWEPNTRIEIVADTTNFRGRAKLDRVIWNLVPDPQTGLTQVLAGQSDFWEAVPADAIARVDSSATARAVPYPGLQYAFLGFNLRNKSRDGPHPLFGDRAVRRALSMAVDRKGMLTNVFGSLGQSAFGPFPRSLSVADTTLRLPAYDTTAAKALLDSAGWKAGADGMRSRSGRALAFSIMVPNSSRPRMSYAVLLQEQLRKVGAKVDIDALQFPQFFARQEARDFDTILNAYATDPSPAGARQAWSSEGLTKGGQNYLSYASKPFDVALDSVLSALTPAERSARAHRAFQLLADDAPAIWLYDVLTVAAAHKRLKPVNMRADLYWANLADWSIPSDARIDRDRIGVAAAKR
ncbi:MAG: ABC-type transporter, periplasmic subunit [Gemmatimonadetes bacterium]|nr:ABC-type transporter, periplasmic subunit [Gemmatimonadota bacterium]